MKETKHTIFSTPIWGFYLNSHDYQSLDYRDYILEMSTREPSEKKSNFGGWQSRDNIHETEGIFRELTSALNKVANEILKDQGHRPVEVKEMWANVNGRHCCNGAHIHSGILSGVFYLQVPKDSGRLVLINPAVRSDGRSLRESNYPIQPEKLACILFPSWLEHYVEPNLSDEVRISLSFNVDVINLL
jgi:uncharacterized protein (TIGR02466 family)